MLETVDLPVADLDPHPRNAKTHDIPLLRDSLRRFGQYRAIVVRKPAGRRKRHQILAGHGTWRAAREEQWEKIACHVIDVDDESALRILAVDNRATELGGYNDQALAELLSALPDLETTGYTQKDLDKLVDSLTQDTGDQDIDDDLPARFGVVVDVPDEAAQARVMEAIVALGFEPRALYA
jgi:ParB-like chromosome segregation protein Spo0J